jgi:hypothetical protein
MTYKRWSPNSRRDRRRRGRPRREATQGAERTLFLIVGLFLLATILVLAAFAFFAR